MQVHTHTPSQTLDKLSLCATRNRLQINYETVEEIAKEWLLSSQPIHSWTNHANHSPAQEVCIPYISSSWTTKRKEVYEIKNTSLWDT